MFANSKLDKAADNIRILTAAMVEKAKSGHPGGAMGGADFINLLYTEFLRYDPENPSYPFRDRFFLDPGHMSPSGAAPPRATPRPMRRTAWRILRDLWGRATRWPWAPR